MRRLLTVCLAGLLLSTASAGARAEIVYQFSPDANGVYKGPFALLSFAKVDRSRYIPTRDRISLDLNLQHYGYFGFGCAAQTGKLYYLRNSTPPVGSRTDGPFGGSARREIAWKTVTPGVVLLEASPNDPNYARIRAAVNEIRAQRAFILLGVREAAVDPQDALGEVLSCAASAEQKRPARMQFAQGE